MFPLIKKNKLQKYHKEKIVKIKLKKNFKIIKINKKRFLNKYNKLKNNSNSRSKHSSKNKILTIKAIPN